MKTLNYKKIPFNTVDNPRLDNNDLGPIKCDRCGCQTCAYLEIKTNVKIVLLCAGCLGNGLEMIYKAILNGTKRKRAAI